MEYKIIKNQKYIYDCDNCGNEFESFHRCDPDICHSCGYYGTFNEDIEEFDETHQYCPICKGFFRTSIYLNDIMQDERVKWLANMVMHYRHDHLRSWDNTWGRRGYGSRFLSPEVYEEEKRKVNERAKRQILRKCKDYMIVNGFHVDDVLGLQHTESETIKLYEKALGYRKLVS
jgi:hypothetical protein